METSLQVVLAQIVRLLGLYQLLLHLQLPNKGVALCWPCAFCEHSVSLIARGLLRHLLLRCLVIVSLFSGRQRRPVSSACRVQVVPGGRQRPGLALKLVLQVPDALFLGRVPLLHFLQLPVLRLQRRLRTWNSARWSTSEHARSSGPDACADAGLLKRPSRYCSGEDEEL